MLIWLNPHSLCKFQLKFYVILSYLLLLSAQIKLKILLANQLYLLNWIK